MLIMAERVNHPPHYNAGGIECIDALEAATSGLQGIEAFCTANAIKYLWRWKLKNGEEDFRRIKNNPPCGLSSLARGFFCLVQTFRKRIVISAP